jgi:hypothetical protein
MYDHSGITIRTSPFSCPWDSGQIGFIYATPERIREFYGVKRITAKVKADVLKHLHGEIETYDKYLTGEVYRYLIIDPDGNDVDSCSGYYSEPKEIITECKSFIDSEIARREKEELIIARDVNRLCKTLC